jgi:hypothetical protein
MPVTRRRRLVKPSTSPCGVQEQPVGYSCNKRKGHKGAHACVDGERDREVE